MITIRVRVGDSYPHTKVLTDVNGAAIDLTGSTPTLNVYDASTGGLIASTSCILSATPTDGSVTFTLQPEVVSAPAMYTILVNVAYSTGVSIWPTTGDQGLWVY